jgi:uncharacterized short protein YbdD (DUF466 family)
LRKRKQVDADCFVAQLRVLVADTTSRIPDTWHLCTGPADIDEYVRQVSEMANEQFRPQVGEPDYSKYYLRDKELGNCFVLAWSAFFVRSAA